MTYFLKSTRDIDFFNCDYGKENGIHLLKPLPFKDQYLCEWLEKNI